MAEDIFVGGFEGNLEEPVEPESEEEPAAAPAEEPAAPEAEPYTYESLTSEQKDKLSQYLTSLGLNKDFLMSAQNFNATPLEKRQKLFAAIQARNMAEGGLVTPGNIDVSKLPAVRNPDGTVSTVRSMSVNINGKEVLIPTVINGRIVSEKDAINQYMRTGRHLGIFDTPESATTYAQKLHEMEAQRVKKARGGPVYTPQEELLLRRYASR
jgi:hypothetical protein